MVESIYDQEHQKFSAELGKQAASLTPRIQVCCCAFPSLSCISSEAGRHRVSEGLRKTVAGTHHGVSYKCANARNLLNADEGNELVQKTPMGLSRYLWTIFSITTLQALRMDLGHGMIQNPAAEVAEVIEYLVTCEKTLASLYTLADCLISWQARSNEHPPVTDMARH